LERLVVLGEWSFRERCERREDAPYAFGVHDERPHVIRRFRIGFEVWHVVANPSLLRLVPPNLLARCIPRFARRIARRAVIHHATIRRPRPRPVWIDAEPRWVLSSSSLHLRPGFRPRSAIQPVTGGRRSIIFKPCEPRKLLARLDRHTRLLIVCDVGERLAVDLLSHFSKRRVVWIGIRPGEGQDWIRELAAFFLIQLANLQKDSRKYLLIDFRLAWRRKRCILPL